MSSQSLSGCFGEEKGVIPVLGVEPQILLSSVPQPGLFTD
jgi:hypothetical protein